MFPASRREFGIDLAVAPKPVEKGSSAEVEAELEPWAVPLADKARLRCKSAEPGSVDPNSEVLLISGSPNILSLNRERFRASPPTKP